jgi:polyisoprenyl-phosphate glycosyltransferase
METKLAVRKQRLCVIIPVHNEADNLVALVRGLETAAGQLHRWNMEILFVDDGSSDASVQQMERIRACGTPVGFICLSRNFGHQAALCAGLENVHGDAIITMDSDLQHPPDEIPRMVEAYERGADVVQMVRSSSIGGGKGLCSEWFYRTFNYLSDTRIVPNGADFRLISGQVRDVLLRIPEREKFLRGLIPSLGFRQKVLEFDQTTRMHGAPTYSFWMSLRLARKALFDYSEIPLRMVLWLGATISLLSFVIGTGHVVWKLSHWNLVVPGFTDLITAIFLLSGCILASLGIVGRYLMLILEQVRGRPLFVITERTQGMPLSPPDEDRLREERITIGAGA